MTGVQASCGCVLNKVDMAGGNSYYGRNYYGKYYGKYLDIRDNNWCDDGGTLSQMCRLLI